MPIEMDQIQKKSSDESSGVEIPEGVSEAFKKLLWVLTNTLSIMLQAFLTFMGYWLNAMVLTFLMLWDFMTRRK